MKKGLLKKIAAIAAAGAISIGIIGCGSTSRTSSSSNASSNQSKLDKIKSSGKLVIGTSADYPPYEFHATVDGSDKIVGFDIDIAQKVADDLGVKLEIKDMDFDGLLVALQSDKVDMVFAGMTPTEERKENVDFSDIYYEAVQKFVLRSGEETSIKSIDDLKNMKIGVQKGSIQEGLAKDNFDEANIKSLAKVTDLVLDLKNNKVDAVLMEDDVAKANCDKNTGIAMADFEVKDDEGGAAIAFKKNSAELKEEVDKVIKNLKDENKIEEFVQAANDLSAQQ